MLWISFLHAEGGKGIPLPSQMPLSLSLNCSKTDLFQHRMSVLSEYLMGPVCVALVVTAVLLVSGKAAL